MTTIADAALAYSKRGWKPVPVDRKTKKAIGKAWQKRPFAPEQFNGNAQNVGIQLGPVSGGLVDVDLDSQAAIGLALEFLPATGAIFGHRSKPASHQLYVADFNGEKRANIEFLDGAMIAELRIGAGGKGAVTIVPPSMHVTGEKIEWVRDGDPAHVSADDLKRAVTKLAIACLLKQHYPPKGARHKGALAIGGVLARAGWQADEIHHLVKVVATAADDEEWLDRVNTAAGSVEAKGNDVDLPGLPSLLEIWGPEVTKQIAKWLDYHETRPRPEGVPQYSDEALALHFAHQYANALRFVAVRSKWMSWNGYLWTIDETLAAFDRARLICRQHAAACRKARAASALASAKTVAAVERLAKVDRRLAATTEQWDMESEIINTPTREQT
jgi:hypothetical protein